MCTDLFSLFTSAATSSAVENAATISSCVATLAPAADCNRADRRQGARGPSGHRAATGTIKRLCSTIRLGRPDSRRLAWDLNFRQFHDLENFRTLADHRAEPRHPIDQPFRDVAAMQWKIGASGFVGH